MPRCSYPNCDRLVREPNKFGLCHVHVDMAEFFLWFSETLQRMQEVTNRGSSRSAAVRPSGLIVPSK